MVWGSRVHGSAHAPSHKCKSCLHKGLYNRSKRLCSGLWGRIMYPSLNIIGHTRVSCFGLPLKSLNGPCQSTLCRVAVRDLTIRACPCAQRSQQRYMEQQSTTRLTAMPTKIRPAHHHKGPGKAHQHVRGSSCRVWIAKTSVSLSCKAYGTFCW